MKLNNTIIYDGKRVVFEYEDADSFDNLDQAKCKQVIAFAFHNGKLLVVNHSKRVGEYVPVGGGIEPGEKPEEAMIREVQEESNMKVLYCKPIGYQKAYEEDEPKDFLCQLRYFCVVEPYGPFMSDPAGDVTELVECDPQDYKKYFDWGAVGEHIVERAVEMLGLYKQ